MRKFNVGVVAIKNYEVEAEDRHSAVDEALECFSFDLNGNLKSVFDFDDYDIDERDITEIKN